TVNSAWPSAAHVAPGVPVSTSPPSLWTQRYPTGVKRTSAGCPSNVPDTTCTDAAATKFAGRPWTAHPPGSIALLGAAGRNDAMSRSVTTTGAAGSSVGSGVGFLAQIARFSGLQFAGTG